MVSFVGRVYVNPKPFYTTPNPFRKATLISYTETNSMKNTMTLSYRSLDNNRADQVYLYLPALRRTIRGEAGSDPPPYRDP